MTQIRNVALDVIDKETLFHPFTSIADQQSAGSRIMKSAQGLYLTDSDGKRYLDGSGALWCVNVGYGRERIAKAISDQAHAMAYFHSFTQMANEPSILLAEKILQHTPAGMSKVFFGNSGSDANDTNVKIVWSYQNARGKPGKQKIISRLRGYHGSTVMGASLCGLPYMHKAFNLPISQVIYTKSPDAYHDKPAGLTEAQHTQYLAAELEALILETGAENIGAFIAEPVMGSGGVVVPPAGYFPAIQQVLTKYDILMIADEVICGFGRLGTWFGSERLDIKPDIMTMAKGLSSGYQPISASVVSDQVWNVLRDNSTAMGSFSHGYTYSAHPIAAAAALENVKIIEEEGLVEKAAAMAPVFQAQLRDALADHPLVGDIRGIGMIMGVETVANKSTKDLFPASLAVATRIMKRGYDHGVLVRGAMGNTIAMSPPLIISRDEVGLLAERVKAALDDVADDLTREGIKISS